VKDARVSHENVENLTPADKDLFSTQTMGWLEHLDPGREEWFITAAEAQGRRIRFIASYRGPTGPAMAAFLRHHNGVHHLFFHLNPVRPGTHGHHASGEDITEVRLAAFDFDLAKCGGDRAKLEAWILLMAPAAAAIIWSGGGLQVFFRIAVQPAAWRERFEKEWANLSTELGSDSVFDLPRLMRLPWTVNMKAVDGRQPTLATELMRPPFAVESLPLASIVSALEPLRMPRKDPKAAAPHENGIAQAMSVLQAAAPRLEALIERKDLWLEAQEALFAAGDPAAIRAAVPSGSEVTMAMAASMKLNRVDLVDAAAALWVTPECDVGDVDKWNGDLRARLRAIARPWVKARGPDQSEPKEKVDEAFEARLEALRAAREHIYEEPGDDVDDGALVEFAWQESYAEEPEIIPWLVRGTVTEILGSSNLGKTWLAHLIAVAIAFDRPDLLHAEKIERPGAVVLILNEDSPNESRRRQATLRSALGLKPEDQKYPILTRRSKKPLKIVRAGPQGLERTQDFLAFLDKLVPVQKEHGIALVIYDTRTTLREGGEEKSNDEATYLDETMARLTEAVEASTGVIHHKSKAAVRDSDPTDEARIYAGRGASATANAARFQIQIERASPREVTDFGWTGARRLERRFWFKVDLTKTQGRPAGLIGWYRYQDFVIQVHRPEAPGSRRMALKGAPLPATPVQSVQVLDDVVAAFRRLRVIYERIYAARQATDWVVKLLAVEMNIPEGEAEAQFDAAVRARLLVKRSVKLGRGNNPVLVFLPSEITK
jgi:RecA-family ATPase